MLSRERIYRTEGVVLRRQDLGEADRLLTVYSLDCGKLRLVAKGVRRPRSRKAGHLEPFTRVKLLLARGRELDIITQAEAIETYPGFQQDLILFGQASYTVELLDRFTVEREEHQPLYRLLINTLERLVSGEDPAATMLFYELRLLDYVGYRPELFHCVGCGEDIRPQGQFFSAMEGGILCPACGRERGDVRPITITELKVLRHYVRNPFGIATSTQIRPSIYDGIDRLMEGYLAYLLERKLHAPEFIRRVLRMKHKGVEPNRVR